jgi:Ser/Thr protein kinase RdoA (MazF antagonist)
MRLLPPGFLAAEPFVADWVLADASARMAKRQSSQIEDIRSFYEAMLPLGEAALAHLRGFALGALPPEEERLLKLMLALAEVAPAVEWYNDPRVHDGFPIERIRYLRQIPDVAAQ